VDQSQSCCSSYPGTSEQILWGCQLGTCTLVEPERLHCWVNHPPKSIKTRYPDNVHTIMSATNRIDNAPPQRVMSKTRFCGLKKVSMMHPVAGKFAIGIPKVEVSTLVAPFDIEEGIFWRFKITQESRIIDRSFQRTNVPRRTKF
jgi:hypothetical protein